MLNVKDFDAKGDGSTDDSPAFAAAIAAMSDGLGTYRGRKLYIPAGDYLLSSDLRINRPGVFQGEGGGNGQGGTRLIMATGKRVTVDGPNTSGDWPHEGAFSVLQGLEIHAAGRLSRPMVWEPSKIVEEGARVRATVRETAGDYGRDTRYVFICTQAGVTGAAPPRPAASVGTGNRWNTTLGSLTTDGTAVWKCTVEPGILMLARATLRDVFVRGFRCAGIHVQGGAGEVPPTNANCFKVYDTRVQWCGLGIAVVGSDANAGLVCGFDVEGSGYWPGESGGVEPDAEGCWDHSFLGTTWVGCHVAACTGSGYDLSDGGPRKSVFLGCYTEGDSAPNKLRFPGISLGGAQGAGWDAKSREGVQLNADGSTGLWSRHPDGKHVRSYLSPEQYSAVQWGCDDDLPNFWKLTYGHASAPLPGWWSVTYGWQNAQHALAFSNFKAAEGAGLVRLPTGWLFEGNSTVTGVRGICFGQLSDWCDKRVRGGLREVGERWMPAGGVTRPADGVVFQSAEVTVAGYRGAPWAANASRTTGYAPWSMFPDVCEPGNGYAYVCHADGVTGPTPPEWPTTTGALVTESHPSAPAVWRCVGPVPTVAYYGKRE